MIKESPIGETVNLKHDKEINIATAGNRFAKKWKNKSLTISEFVKSISVTTRTQETFDDYLAMPKDDQDAIKDVGAFIGASCKEGRRRKEDIANRHILTLDLDYCDTKTIPIIKDILKGVCHSVYSTHKSAPNKPRLRLIVYPDRVMLPDEYHAVSRKIADKVGIEYVDPTTHDVNRLFYKPSTSQDGEFVFWHNDAPFLPVNEIMEEYGPNEAWKDVTLWPTSSRETRNLDRMLKKQADPLTKKGIVGAFCRHVSIYDALEQLSDVYKKESKDRYTYIDGSSSKGLVIYSGAFAYSNHSTDPACGQTCNAFDLLRIHKFGHLDDNAKHGTPTHRMPSFTAMAEYCREFESVKIELISAGLDIDPSEFDAFEKTGEWISDLQTGDNGQIKPTFLNASVIVANDLVLKNKMRKNNFSMKIENIETGENWNDLDSIDVRAHIGKRYNVDFPEKKVEDSIFKHAETNGYHPVCQYLESVVWDGIERAETLFIDYMGCEDNQYSREISKHWLTAAVCRVFEPGYKFDTAIVLSGVQGIGKTTFIRELGLGRWYGELTSFDPKIAMEEISGKWIIEINEMGATNKQELEAQKSFLSAQHTTVRMAYARHAFDFKRQCVFIGSTNATEYLKDSTGNRRWWPIDCHEKKIDIEKLKGEVDQIWAEAYMLYVQGAKTYLSDAAEEMAKGVQESKRESDPNEGVIEAWLETDAEKDRYELPSSAFGSEGKEVRDRVCVIEIWQDCFMEKRKPRPQESKQISRILDENSNWIRVNSMRFGIRFGRQRGWEKVVPF
jgi:predicted P-loop ATPase